LNIPVDGAARPADALSNLLDGQALRIIEEQPGHPNQPGEPVLLGEELTCHRMGSIGAGRWWVNQSNRKGGLSRNDSQAVTGAA